VRSFHLRVDAQQDTEEHTRPLRPVEKTAGMKVVAAGEVGLVPVWYEVGSKANRRTGKGAGHAQRAVAKWETQKKNDKPA